MKLLVEAPDEGDGIEVFAAAIAIGDPLARLAREVEIEHRRDGIDAQAIDVIFV